MKKLLAQSILWRGFYFFSVLLVNVFLSRYLQAAGSGHLYFITIIFSFSQLVLGLGFEQGVTYFASGNIIKRNRLFVLISIWSFVSGLLMIGFTHIYFIIDKTLQSSLSSQWSLYGFLFVSGQALMGSVTALFYTKENYVLPNFLLSIINIVFVFIIPPKDQPINAADAEYLTTLYFYTFFISGLVLLISFYFYNKEERDFGFPMKIQLNRFFKYSLTALSANVIFFLVYRIDYFFVNKSAVATAADLGNYIQVSKLGQMLLIVPQIIASVVFPKTASGTQNVRMNNLIMMIARLFSQLFIVLMVFVIFFGNWFFIKLFGETFNKMQLTFVLLIPGIFCLSVNVLVAAYFGGRGKVSINVVGAMLALIITVICDFLFVPLYGIVAAAIVSTLAYCINLSYALYIFYKEYSINLVDFFKWRKEDYTWLTTLFKRDI